MKIRKTDRAEYNIRLHHRLAHILHQLGAPLVARIISEIAHSATGIDIHPGAQIGDSFLSITAPAW